MTAREELAQYAAGAKSLGQLCREYEKHTATVHLEELVGGALSFYAAAAVARVGGIHLFVAEDRDAAIASLAGEDVNIVCCEKHSIEITHASVTKGTGLLALAAQLGIPAEETIAVGDADNDLPMLRAAGLGVAMGNANENARAASDVTVADNDHDGCAEAIRRFLLA